ncbi:MAG: hypothetical protein R3330_13535, partial [Saprospiraceae bacterium]|nr:hypothetical protein [Saprospiraceae bacterium]
MKILIDTLEYGVVDVSDDVNRGTLTLKENALANLDLTLLNHRRKYDGIFTPNDIISVQLKRISWLPVLTGYLSEVPYVSVFPRAIQLNAKCSLKKLRNWPWDPGTGPSIELLYRQSGNASGEVDGGIRTKVMDLLKVVGQWPADKIHIGQIPSNWVDRLLPLYEKLQQQVDAPPDVLGRVGVANGTSPSSEG